MMSEVRDALGDKMSGAERKVNGGATPKTRDRVRIGRSFDDSVADEAKAGGPAD